MEEDDYYFDEDDLLDDYINDDANEVEEAAAATTTTVVNVNNNHGHHHVTTTTTSAANNAANNVDVDEHYLDAMMEEAELMMMEEQQQQQQNVSTTTTFTTGSTTTTTAPGRAPGNVHNNFGTTTDYHNDGDDDDDDDDDEEEETTTRNNNNNNRQRVNEYLESRRSRQDGYSLGSFNLDVSNWREMSQPSATGNRSTTATSKSKKFQFASSSLTNNRRRGTNQTVTPSAHFLDLLQFRASKECPSSSSTTTTARPHSSNNNDDKTNHYHHHLLRRSLRTPKHGVESIPMTIGDGTRVHIVTTTTTTTTRNQDRGSGGVGKSSIRSSSSTTSTLGISMKELKRRVDATERHKIAQRNKWNTSGASSSNRNSSTAAARTNNMGNDQLWVDRHAPVSFGHLLSDERTNRAVLRALREWDPYVFGREALSKPNSLYYNNTQQQQQQNDSSNPLTTKSSNHDNNNGGGNNSKDKRPEQNRRVILLSGPPGVGKSTLAHIVARHAGYQAVEVNASDDRSSTVLVDRVVRAMESTTINFAATANNARGSGSSTNHHSGGGKENKNYSTTKGRPNCIILDEIDGADAKGAIQALVDMIKAEIPSNGGGSNNNNNNKKGGTSYLRRPIICICNHKHAPVLRPLHKYALHFNVDAPSSTRLIVRLKDILNKEGLNMSTGGGSMLQKLNDSSGGDIRSCINTLQFASSQAKSHIDLSLALQEVLNGTSLKDTRCDLPSTLSEVFFKSKARKVAGSTSSTTSSSSSYGSPFSSSLVGSEKQSTYRVIESVEGFGDDTTATSAIFMNIMGISYIDPTFDRCSAAHELLSAVDSTQGGVGATGGDMAPQRSYNQLGPVAAGIHLLCRVEIKPRLTLSTRELADAYFQQEANGQLVRQFADGLPPRARHFKCRSLLSSEFIPFALWVLSAGHGPTSLSRAASSVDILTKMEQQQVNRHVRILCSLGLTYVQDQNELMSNANIRKPSYLGGSDGSNTSMRLEPPIHHLVQYRSIPFGFPRRREIPTGMKELIAHQVRLSSLRSGQDDESASENGNVEPSSPPVVEEKSNDVTQSGSATSPIIESKDSNPTTAPGITSTVSTNLSTVTPAKVSPASENKKSPIQKTTPSPNAMNFLGIGAKKAKEMKSARRAAAVGLHHGGGQSSSSSSSNKKIKLAHTGSGFALNQVVRMRYVKGFTQAVRTKCRLEDLE